MPYSGTTLSKSVPLDTGAVSDEELGGAASDEELGGVASDEELGATPSLMEELDAFESLLAGSSVSTAAAVFDSQLAQKNPVKARANFFQCL